MKVYTYSKTRESLAQILDLAAFGEEIRIKRKDGQLFQIIPITENRSPLDIEPITSNVTREEIIAAIHEGRKN